MAAAQGSSVAAHLIAASLIDPAAAVASNIGGDVVLDGAGFLAATSAVVAGLRRAGVIPGDRVVVEMTVSAHSIVVATAVLAAGAVLIPVRPEVSDEELVTIARDAKPRLALLGEHTEVLRSQRLDALVDQPSDSTLDVVARSDDDDALIIYTSGTTGSPKGVVLSHGAVVAGIEMLHDAWGWTARDRLILALPLFHVHGLVAAAFGALARGSTIIVVEHFSVDAVEASIVCAQATMFFGVPTMFHAIDQNGHKEVLARLRLAVSGSAPLDSALWRRFESSGVSILERYGMTETLLTLSNPLEGRRFPGTVGTPLPGVAIRIEPDGELLVSTPARFSRYLNQPEETQRVLDDGWVRTGDLVTIADGVVSIVGRKKELIISGGFNIVPSEVEAVLARDPAVFDVAVAGRRDQHWGEVVEAWVIPVAGATIDSNALLAFAAAHLPPHKRPRAIHLVDHLPRTALGKIQRTALGH